MNFSLFLSLVNFVISAPTEPKRLISLSPENAVWMTESEVYDLVKVTPKVHFIDITDHQDLVPQKSFAPPVYPTKLSQQTLVKKLTAQIDQNYLKSFLKNFTSFNNRFVKSKTGVDSANALFDELNSIKQQLPRQDMVFTITKFPHSFSGQFSLIARLEASVCTGLKDVVIMGCHFDSINSKDPLNGVAPGLDDDATGVVNNLQVIKLLLGEPSFVPTRPLEFHFYAGEEIGLLGSQDIAKSYVNRVSVYGMLQTDMTGYLKSKDIAIYQDNVDPSLTAALTLVAKEYTSLNVVTSKCSYGCSDHASWFKAGFPTCLHAEAKIEDMNPFVHGNLDLVDQVSFDHISEFVKNTLGFAIEMSTFLQ